MYEKPQIITFTKEDLESLQLACGSCCGAVCCTPSGSGHD